MSGIDHKHAWESYCEKTTAHVRPILKKLGYTLQEEQPHIVGERYLMQAMTTTSGKKLILLGEGNQGERVIIKVSNDKNGIAEIEHERKAREASTELRFAYRSLITPKEVLYAKEGDYVLAIQEFIPQEQSFIERPLKEQFLFSLDAFKAQESVHAAVRSHVGSVREIFEMRDASGYIASYDGFMSICKRLLPGNEQMDTLLKNGKNNLMDGRERIEQYCGFLTHTDFVPHNFRIQNNTLYLLDHSSLRFGNKHEGWARFLNFMTLYNPELESLLIEYVNKNRSKEEHESLRLMRIYRLGEIITYYANTLDKCDERLCALNKARIDFWSKVLDAVLGERDLKESVREEYKKTRDTLRSDDEQKRQVGLH